MVFATVMLAMLLSALDRTVSYLLGNIYAKANVSSRHQLTQLVRQDPTVFGLPSAV